MADCPIPPRNRDPRLRALDDRDAFPDREASPKRGTARISSPGRRPTSADEGLGHHARPPRPVRYYSK